MGAAAIFFGVLDVPFWLAIVAIFIGAAGVGVGFFGGELPARNYFQIIAFMAGLSLIMALGAVLSGSHALLGVPLTTGSFMLFVIVVAAAFFAGFEPEVIEKDREIELAAQ